MSPFGSCVAAFGGDAWLGLMATGLLLSATSGVLWERDRHRRRAAAVLLLAVGLIIVGLVGLRADGLGMLLGTPLLVAGVFCLVAAIVQGVAALARGAADSAV